MHVLFYSPYSIFFSCILRLVFYFLFYVLFYTSHAGIHRPGYSIYISYSFRYVFYYIPRSACNLSPVCSSEEIAELEQCMLCTGLGFRAAWRSNSSDTRRASAAASSLRASEDLWQYQDCEWASESGSVFVAVAPVSCMSNGGVDVMHGRRCGRWRED